MLAFARPALALSLVAALKGESVFGDDHNGLFLAAPRRTGKSTFLQHDLAPALQAQGVTVVYVDLWADTRRDPGGLIAEAIGAALQQHLGIVARTARKAGLDKVKVAGLEVDTSKIGQTSGLTLAQALGMLIDHAGQAVARGGHVGLGAPPVGLRVVEPEDHVIGTHELLDVCRQAVLVSQRDDDAAFLQAASDGWAKGLLHGLRERRRCVRDIGAPQREPAPVHRIFSRDAVDDQVEACRRVFASDTRWTVVRGSDLVGVTTSTRPLHARSGRLQA